MTDSYSLKNVLDHQARTDRMFHPRGKHDMPRRRTRFPSKIESGNNKKLRCKNWGRWRRKVSRELDRGPSKRKQIHNIPRKGATTDGYGGSWDDSRSPRSRHSQKSSERLLRNRCEQKCNGNEKEYLEVLCPVSDWYRTALDFLDSPSGDKYKFTTTKYRNKSRNDGVNCTSVKLNFQMLQNATKKTSCKLTFLWTSLQCMYLISINKKGRTIYTCRKKVKSSNYNIKTFDSIYWKFTSRKSQKSLHMPWVKNFGLFLNV